ncbi:hypothetical protein NPIL_588421 [Nephila pilipes]|uniref:Uncharacterized protein n=1 Tax=Nephila pilipes TaxID=299642 RepID=A0A8X6U287_NEPPI|nr:hypothetical protein NPIL_588421 [Nephila pilipes]
MSFSSSAPAKLQCTHTKRISFKRSETVKNTALSLGHHLMAHNKQPTSSSVHTYSSEVIELTLQWPIKPTESASTTAKLLERGKMFPNFFRPHYTPDMFPQHTPEIPPFDLANEPWSKPATKSRTYRTCLRGFEFQR